MKLKRGVMPAADFTDLEWLGGPPLRLADLAGRVVLVFFWDYACVHCLRALAYLKVWHGRYADKGLTVIGVHAPEFDFGLDAANVRRAVEEHGIPFPVGLDNRFTTWHAYSNRFWPAWYLVDRDGFLSDCHFGEGGYGETELAIQGLLREGNPRILLPRVIEPLRPEDAGLLAVRPVSPEVYLGYRRGRIGNPEGFRPGERLRYARPVVLSRDVFYAEGEFLNEAECLVHAGEGTGRICLSYDAAEVHLVAAPGGGTGGLTVCLDGRTPDAAELGEAVSLGPEGAVVRLDAPRLYPLLRHERGDRHTLELTTTSPGVRLYSISFLGTAS